MNEGTFLEVVIRLSLSKFVIKFLIMMAFFVIISIFYVLR